jgi:hypothetical protein
MVVTITDLFIVHRLLQAQPESTPPKRDWPWGKFLNGTAESKIRKDGLVYLVLFLIKVGSVIDGTGLSVTGCSEPTRS